MLGRIAIRHRSGAANIRADRKGKGTKLSAAFCVLLVLSLVVGLTACGGAAATPAGTASRTLVVLADDIGAGINPDGPAISFTSTEELVNNLYDPLVDYSVKTTTQGVQIPDYNKLEGRLAESWTQNGLKWTFKLRSGVKSCSGNTLSADDVIWTLQRGKSVSGAAPIAWFLLNVGGVLGLEPLNPKATAADKELKDTEARKIDDLTVEITQLSTNSLFPRVLSIFSLVIFDSKEMKKHATAQDPWAHTFADNEGAAGYGPYCLSTWDKNQQIVYTANPNYYRGKPYYDKVIVKKVPENANRVAAIQSGQADVVINLTPREFNEVAKSSGVEVLGWSSNESVHLAANYKSKLWGGANNKLLRQAIAYALPYTQIIDSVFYGAAQRYYNLVPTGYVGRKEIKRYETDLAKAKQLLVQAGFPEGKGLDQYKQDLQLYYVVERKAALEPLALQIQTALAQIGVPVTLAPLSQVEFGDRELVKKDLPLALLDYEHPVGPDVAYTAQLYFVTEAKGGINNITNYSSDVVDNAWGKSMSMAAGPERDAVLSPLQDQLMEDLPWIPLVEKKSQIAVKKGISGWYGKPDTTLTYWSFTAAK